jgi:hypothetical protein
MKSPTETQTLIQTPTTIKRTTIVMSMTKFSYPFTMSLPRFFFYASKKVLNILVNLIRHLT